MTIVASLVSVSVLPAHRQFRLLHPRKPRFDVSAVSQYSRSNSGTPGETHR